MTEVWRTVFYRKIPGHLKDQNWAAIGIDFVIVVGVYLGIPVDDRDEARANRECAREMLDLNTAAACERVTALEGAPRR